MQKKGRGPAILVLFLACSLSGWLCLWEFRKVQSLVGCPQVEAGPRSEPSTRGHETLEVKLSSEPCPRGLRQLCPTESWCTAEPGPALTGGMHTSR